MYTELGSDALRDPSLDQAAKEFADLVLGFFVEEGLTEAEIASRLAAFEEAVGL